LQESTLNATWVDVRDILRTDDNFRDAGIDWEFSKPKIEENITSLFKHYDIIVTQGFIGTTDQNESTTLGREGSDYTAAVFAHILNAESVTIWKDVDAVMSADPKKYPDATNITSLSYLEVIEMAYYGAQVIHPKTIKPLQNKNIPLLVKSFINPTLQGTTISNSGSKNLPPIVVHKEKQVLMSFKSKDFSFVEDKPAEMLQQLFSKIRVKPNLMQHTAISLLCCFDYHPEKIEQLALEAEDMFDVQLEKGLELLTIRHYNKELLHEFVKNKIILLEQKTTETVQFLMRM
jgi:aspartate kinase